MAVVNEMFIFEIYGLMNWNTIPCVMSKNGSHFCCAGQLIRAKDTVQRTKGLPVLCTVPYNSVKINE